MPLGFIALALATAMFGVVQLGWIPPTQGAVAALTAGAATLPLQLLASVFGYLSRDPVAATGFALQAGTWGVVGLVSLTSPAGATSPGLGALLVIAAVAVLIPGVAGYSKLVPAAVMVGTAIRFAITGGYELTSSLAWKAAAGWAGIALAALALYAALALELEGARRHTVLSVGRRGLAREAVQGEGVFDTEELAREPGVRSRL
jgi:succinate-acetate transporter protein